MLRILYLVHDLCDPAVRRRVLMLVTGGARVTLAGFRRGGEAPEISGVPIVDLGVTRDGDFAQRLLAVGRAAATIRVALRGIEKPDLLIARNLEMLALAARARRALGLAEAPVAYECLDIHRLMLRDDVIGRTMRAAERRLARDVDLLITSSPAFLREYFTPYGQTDASVELVENRHLDLARHSDVSVGRRAQPPWRIGWYGALRCSHSLDVLGAFARHGGGRFEVVLRGRPALAAIPDFAARVRDVPWLAFRGAYRNPEDIAAIYGDIHFSWAVDFFEADHNSRWLLPNRLYEGSRYGAVPIAVRGTETARFLEERGIGIVLSEASPEALADALFGMDASHFARLEAAVLGLGERTWSCDAGDCRDLVARLAALRRGSRTALVPASGLAT
jgi:succinoglycan biosynthesis protein ExoL